ncbi:MAG: hypothetical protein M3270_06380 [Thermoproteota archaeon]|nr:hypothetical protein [Thermoproteota archaeon]
MHVENVAAIKLIEHNTSDKTCSISCGKLSNYYIQHWPSATASRRPRQSDKEPLLQTSTLCLDSNIELKLSEDPSWLARKPAHTALLLNHG